LRVWGVRSVKGAGTNPISSQGRGGEKNTGLFDLF